MENTGSLSAIELADRLSVTPGRIRQIALSLGLSRKGRDWLFTADDADRIAEHTRAGAVLDMTKDLSFRVVPVFGEPSDSNTIKLKKDNGGKNAR